MDQNDQRVKGNLKKRLERGIKIRKLKGGKNEGPQHRELSDHDHTAVNSTVVAVHQKEPAALTAGFPVASNDFLLIHSLLRGSISI